jgi:glycine/D-amino acid oxidase-like deaminating enzyme
MVGEVLETMDGLAHIGINPGGESNMYIVTGDSGNGMTHGIISSFIIPDLIEEKQMNIQHCMIRRGFIYFPVPEGG